MGKDASFFVHKNAVNIDVMIFASVQMGKNWNFCAFQVSSCVIKFQIINCWRQKLDCWRHCKNMIALWIK